MRRGWPSGLDVSQMISPSKRLQCSSSLAEKEPDRKENRATTFLVAVSRERCQRSRDKQAPTYDFTLRIRPNPVSIGALKR